MKKKGAAYVARVDPVKKKDGGTAYCSDFRIVGEADSIFIIPD